MRKSSGGLVYSTESGRMCPDCRRPIAECNCRTRTAAPAGDGTARVRLETKGRGGKSVTVVWGLGLDDAALAALGKRLRSACGSGGTAKDGRLELQGDHVERAMRWLADEGWRVLRAGG